MTQWIEFDLTIEISRLIFQGLTQWIKFDLTTEIKMTYMMALKDTTNKYAIYNAMHVVS